MNQILRMVLEDDEDEDDLVKELGGDAPVERYLPLGFVIKFGSVRKTFEALLALLKTVNPQAAYTIEEIWREGKVGEGQLAYSTLPNLLGRYCLPYTYFGQRQSEVDDNTPWGVWVDKERIFGLIDMGEHTALKSMYQGEAIPEGAQYVVVLSDPIDEKIVALLNGQTEEEIWRVKPNKKY